MALLNSESVLLGTFAPDFDLKGVDGKRYTFASFKDKKVLVVLFLCVHCPYVQAVEDRIIQLRKYYQDQSVQLVAICSNDSVAYPEDRPENILKHSEDKGYGFPYLVDDTQQVAKDYGAVCTPDIFVYGPDRKLAYHGRIDDSWKDASKVTKEELKEAINAILEDLYVAPVQHPSMGCSIKWK